MNQPIIESDEVKSQRAFIRRLYEDRESLRRKHSQDDEAATQEIRRAEDKLDEMRGI